MRLGFTVTRQHPEGAPVTVQVSVGWDENATHGQVCEAINHGIETVQKRLLQEFPVECDTFVPSRPFTPPVPPTSAFTFLVAVAADAREDAEEILRAAIAGEAHPTDPTTIVYRP